MTIKKFIMQNNINDLQDLTDIEKFFKTYLKELKDILVECAYKGAYNVQGNVDFIELNNVKIKSKDFIITDRFKDINKKKELIKLAIKVIKEN